MSEYFPEPKSLEKVKVELDFSNHARKTDLKNLTGIDVNLLINLYLCFSDYVEK